MQLSTMIAAFCVALAQAAPAAGRQVTDPSMIAKEGRSAAERKLDSQLLQEVLAAAGDARSRRLDPAPRVDRSAAAPETVVTVQVAGAVGPSLVAAIESLGGTVIDQSTRWGRLTATLPIGAVLPLAARDDVKSVRSPPRARTH